MRPDFRRSELNEGQVEMKVDDDAHSIVPGSTSAYVQKNLDFRRLSTSLAVEHQKQRMSNTGRMEKYPFLHLEM